VWNVQVHSAQPSVRLHVLAPLFFCRILVLWRTRAWELEVDDHVFEEHSERNTHLKAAFGPSSSATGGEAQRLPCRSADILESWARNGRVCPALTQSLMLRVYRVHALIETLGDLRCSGETSFLRRRKAWHFLVSPARRRILMGRRTFSDRILKCNKPRHTDLQAKCSRNHGSPPNFPLPELISQSLQNWHVGSGRCFSTCPMIID